MLIGITLDVLQFCVAYTFVEKSARLALQNDMEVVNVEEQPQAISLKDQLQLRVKLFNLSN